MASSSLQTCGLWFYAVALTWAEGWAARWQERKYGWEFDEPYSEAHDPDGTQADGTQTVNGHPMTIRVVNATVVATRTTPASDVAYSADTTTKPTTNATAQTPTVRLFADQ
jgi:hypothetical protein